MLNIIIQCAAILFVHMSCGFIIAQIKKDNSIADIFWGLGFILIAWYTLIKNGLYFDKQLLATGLVTIWGLRLSCYIILRNWGKTEDPRYTQLARAWGKKYFYLHSFFKIFMLQGLLLLIICLPAIVINSSEYAPILLLDYVALVLWAIGFIFEAVGDWQLYQFLKEPTNREKIMDQGLWQYTRHPNYFGEVTMWWALWIMAITLPWGLFAIISPITITVLLLFISGIPLAEKQLERKPRFEEYRKKTAIFFPWPPKK